MAKKWKAYPWPERPDEDVEVRSVEVEDEEEIDVVGDSPAVGNAAEGCWGPSSPTAGATAPSPPPHSPSGTTILYNGKFHLVPLQLLVRRVIDVVRKLLETAPILDIFINTQIQNVKLCPVYPKIRIRFFYTKLKIPNFGT